MELKMTWVYVIAGVASTEDLKLAYALGYRAMCIPSCPYLSLVRLPFLRRDESRWTMFAPVLIFTVLRSTPLSSSVERNRETHPWTISRNYIALTVSVIEFSKSPSSMISALVRGPSRSLCFQNIQGRLRTNFPHFDVDDRLSIRPLYSVNLCRPSIQSTGVCTRSTPGGQPSLVNFGSPSPRWHTDRTPSDLLNPLSITFTCRNAKCFWHTSRRVCTGNCYNYTV